METKIEENTNVDSSVGLKDDALGKEIIEEQKKQLETEKDVFVKNIAEVEKTKKNFEKQWEVDKEIYEIIESDFGLIEPVHKYQQNPRYWELQKKKFEFQKRQDTFMAEAKLKEFDRQILILQEQLDSASKKLEEVENGE